MRHQNGWSSTPLWLCYRCRSMLKLRTMMSTIKIQRCCWTMGVDVNLGAWYSSRIWCRRLIAKQNNSMWISLRFGTISKGATMTYSCLFKDKRWDLILLPKVVLGPLHVIYFALSPYASSLLCHFQDISQFFFPLPLSFLGDLQVFEATIIVCGKLLSSHVISQHSAVTWKLLFAISKSLMWNITAPLMCVSIFVSPMAP
jgi:hypothetical protein